MKNHHHSTYLGDQIPPSQMEELKKIANRPITLEEKLKRFDQLALEHEYTDHFSKRKSYRCVLGTFVHHLFSTSMKLPPTGRRQQIMYALKYAKRYLIENPEVSIAYAVGMGAAQERREWLITIGDVTAVDQISILSQEAPQR